MSTGCMLGWYDHNGYTGTNGLQDMEEELDTRFAVVRIYHKPSEWGQTKSLISTVLDDGRLPMVSHKPLKVANSWVAVARGDHDATIDAMVDQYKEWGDEYDGEVIVIFHHEPHDECHEVKPNSTKVNHGRAADFINAFRRFAGKFKDADAGKVKIGYCAVGNTWAAKRSSSSRPYGADDPLWPGGDYVDVLCHDEYNFFHNYSGWESMEETFENVVAVAKYRNRPLIFGEYGSQVDKPNYPNVPAAHDRDTWFRDGAAWLKSNEDARNYVLGLCYYHVDNHDNSDHWWRFVQGPYSGDGRTGFIDGFVEEPYFLTTPIPVSLQSRTVPGTDLGANHPSGGTPSYVQGKKWGLKHEATGLLTGGQNSGLAASPKGGAWVIRDSGEPNDLYWVTQASRARLNFRQIDVTGSTNSDWEDVIRVVEGGTAYLYIHDNRDGNGAGSNPKRLYKVAEPANPATATSVSLISTRYWKFPDSASSSTCGSKQNCEAIFVFQGLLYAVQKTDAAEAEVYRVGDPNSLSTTNSMAGATEAVKVGTIGIHCPSCFSLHADGKTVLVCQHGEIKVYRGKGDTIQSLLTGKNTRVFHDPDVVGSYEGGDWFPYGSSDFLLVSEGDDVADYDVSEGTDTRGTVPAVAYGGGIPSAVAFGTPTVTMTSGAQTVLGVGAIPSPAAYSVEEEAGLDFGLLTVGETGLIEAIGIESMAAVGTPTVTRAEGPGYLFSPPIKYMQPLLSAESRGLARRLFRYYDGIPTPTNIYVLVDGTVTESQPWDQNLIEHIYFGGHVTHVSDAEADVLADAGYGAELVAIPSATEGTWSSWSSFTWGEVRGYMWKELR